MHLDRLPNASYRQKLRVMYTFPLRGGGMTKRYSIVWVLSLAIMALLSVACSRQAVPSSGQSQGGLGNPPTIVFMTDFGTANDAVAICHAVIYGIAPGVRITDITHQVTP